MSDFPDIPRPSQLWQRLSADRKVQAAEAFWHDDNARTEQAEALETIARRIKFRPIAVVRMPVDKKAKHLVSLPAVSELVAARLLVAYHLQQQRPMMSAFLDALGIAHEDGMIADQELKPPAAEQLTAAAKTIAASYPAEDVALYLSTLLWQDFETWGGLSEAPELQLPSAAS